MEELQAEAQRLRKDAEGALRRALDPSDVLPLLHRLARTATPGSDESVFAHRHLAELVATRHPWRAALYARRVTLERPEDDRAWAVLALCQTLLENYRFAAASYQRALACAPKNPWYAHNLGHLLDVALGRSQDALFWLRAAAAAEPGHAEIGASLAHALARAGRVEEAKEVLARAMRSGPSREQLALWRWLERGAPEDQDKPPRSSPVIVPLPGTESWGDAAANVAADVAEEERPAPARRPSLPLSEPRERLATLHAALDVGLESIPLATRQRARARALARETVALDLFSRAHAADPAATKATAAALAYAMVWLHDVPLTQAEVAASFRVNAARLRGRFAELRCGLHLTRDDRRAARPRKS